MVKYFSSSVLIARCHYAGGGVGGSSTIRTTTNSTSRTSRASSASAAAAASVIINNNAIIIRRQSVVGYYYPSSRHLHHRLVVAVPPPPPPPPPLLGITKRGIIIPPNRQTTTAGSDSQHSVSIPSSSSSSSSSSDDDNNNNDNNKTKIGPRRGVRPISINVEDMDDTTLVLLGSLEDHCAREEILKRHIMDVDQCNYNEACLTFDEIAETNFSTKHFYYNKLASVPYYVGIYTAIFVGTITVPLVFHLPTIEWFNEWAVTTDIPEARDLETPLEVSIWSWNWMEPPLGTMSFLLLCSQYIRSQMANLGIKPYTRYIKNKRGEKLANAYPKYNSKILISYSETAKIH